MLRMMCREDNTGGQKTGGFILIEVTTVINSLAIAVYIIRIEKKRIRK